MEALLRPLAKASLAALEDSCVLWECPLGKVLPVSDMRMGFETDKRHASKLTSHMRSRSKLTSDIRRGSKLINDMPRGFRSNKLHAQGLEANK